MSITGIGFALVTSSLAKDFANNHHLHHLASTILVEGANIAAFGTLWVLKFLILNRLFAQIADAELHDAEVDDAEVDRPPSREPREEATEAS